MSSEQTKLSESLEDYLETILNLEHQQKVARVKDIADKLGVLRGTVSSMLKKMAEKNLIHYEPYSFITLTSEGTRIAEEISRRHAVIKDFLQNVLLLDNRKADENACRMEHAMDKEAIDRLVQFIDYIQYCPRTGQDWIEAFVNYFSRNEHQTEDCRECIEDCLVRYHKSQVQKSDT